MKLPDVKRLERAIRVAYEEEPWRIKDMMDHISDPQLACKTWLLDNLTHHGGRGVVLGGWYGLLANQLNFLSLDIDPECKRYGRMLYPDVEFAVDDAFNYLMECDYETIVCTSCEHMQQEDLDMLNYLKDGTQLCLQSNNWEGIGGHINCKASLEEFAADYPSLDVSYAGSLELEDYTRWMIIGTISSTASTT